MDRLTEKLKAASGVVARVTARLEAKADELLARETGITSRVEEVFAPHNRILDEGHAGLDELEQKLALVSNDPLGPSGG